MITDNELFQAIYEATEASKSTDEPGTFTRAEVQEIWGCSEKSALRRLKEGIKLGLIQPRIVMRKNMHGMICPIKGYELVDTRE